MMLIGIRPSAAAETKDGCGVEPLIAWFALFFSIWSVAAASEARHESFLGQWHLWLAVAVRSLAGSVAPIGSGAFSAPLLLMGGDSSVAAARNFAFAIQAVGLTSAATFILSRKMPVDWFALIWALAGCLLGTPLGFVAFGMERVAVEALSLHAILWGSFGFALLRWRGLIAQANCSLDSYGARFGFLAFGAGFAGGLGVSAVLGAGAALPLYLVLVLFRRIALQTALATCILLMAFNSFLGLFWGIATEGFDHQNFRVWLEVAPLACVLAPMGLLLLDRVEPKTLLAIAGTTCVLQTVWSIAWLRDRSGTLYASWIVCLTVCLIGVYGLLAWFGKARSLAENRA